MSANVDGMLRAAIDAFKNGNKAEARTLLDKILEVDEMNENAWMWMSAVVDTADERRTCLENVLVINPNNEKARKGMKSLGFDPDAGSLVPPPAAAAVFTDTSFTTETSSASSSSVWDEDEDDAPPTASSSASSASFRGADVSSNDLDDWISGMGIGGSGKQPALSPAPNPFSATNFDASADLDDEPGFDDFDDRMSSMFSEDEFDLDAAPPPAKPAASRPAAQTGRPAAQPAYTPPSVFDDDDDDDLSMFEDDGDVGITDEDFDEFNALIEEDLPVLPPVRTTSTRPSVSRGSDFAYEEEQIDEDNGEGPDPQALFDLIPKEIPISNRLPGESEPTARGLLIGVIVLVVLNLAALGLVVVNGI